MLRRLVLRSVEGLLALTLLATISAFAAGPDVSYMPASVEKIGNALKARGVIPADADEDQTYAAVQKYLQQKIGKKPIDRVNPLAARALKEREAKFAAKKVTGKRLGQSVSIENSVYVPNIGPVESDNILILLVEFSDPVHNQISKPNNNADYWVPDFNLQHYQEMLFDLTPGAKSMANYYLEQSHEKYTVKGRAYGWFKIPHPESYYGKDSNSTLGSGGTDDANGPVYRIFDLSAVSSATLSLMMWYEIETDYDYGFVEVSADGGAAWTSVPSEYTKVVDTGSGPVNAITGFSSDIPGNVNGWVRANYDLTPWAGKQIKLRFRYSTDGGVSEKGWTIDDISISAIGFFDNADSGTNTAGWDTKGWSLYKGSATKTVNHYYMIEWRTFTGFDETLKNLYNFVGDNVEFFSYNPGALLWYRDGEYGNNWVGVHPGHGFLLIVDSHPVALRTPVYGVPWRTRVQIMDAPFGREKTISNTLTKYGVTKTYPSLSRAVVQRQVQILGSRQPDERGDHPVLRLQFPGQRGLRGWIGGLDRAWLRKVRGRPIKLVWQKILFARRFYEKR